MSSIKQTYPSYPSFHPRESCSQTQSAPKKPWRPSSSVSRWGQPQQPSSFVPRARCTFAEISIECSAAPLAMPWHSLFFVLTLACLAANLAILALRFSSFLASFLSFLASSASVKGFSAPAAGAAAGCCSLESAMFNEKTKGRTSIFCAAYKARPRPGVCVCAVNV